uniref:Uncharacterized protein n=1 Tax=viral metagenome TaxID=1070528 RepID=A0A6C0H795_9ZZZZ
MNVYFDDIELSNIYLSRNIKFTKIIYSTQNYSVNGIWIKIKILENNSLQIKMPEKIRIIENYIIKQYNSSKKYKCLPNEIMMNVSKSDSSSFILFNILGISESIYSFKLNYKIFFIN